MAFFIGLTGIKRVFLDHNFSDASFHSGSAYSQSCPLCTLLKPFKKFDDKEKGWQN